MNKKQLVEAIIEIDPTLDSDKLEIQTNAKLEGILKQLKAKPTAVSDDDLLGSDDLPPPIPSELTPGQDIPPVIQLVEMTGTMELPPQETPIPPTKVETPEGSDLSGEGADAVVEKKLLGHHPMTGKPVYAHEQ